MQLYKDNYISTPSFSIIITSSNINRLYLGDIMKNNYVKNYLENNQEINKGECKIIESEQIWACSVKCVEYNALKYKNWENHKEASTSILKFDVRENKLYIPEKYYLLIVVSYYNRLESKMRRSYFSNKVRRSWSWKKVYNKECVIRPEGFISCNCNDKDDFGIVYFTF